MFSQTELHVASLRAISGIRVRYVTCGVSALQNNDSYLVAVPSTSTAKVVGEDGSYTEYQIDDWIVLVSEMPNPERFPQQGDLIYIGNDDCSPYRVMHPDKNTPVCANFNPLDRPAKAWVIHSSRPR